MDLNRREFLFLLIDYLFLNKSNKILIYLFYDSDEFKLHLVKSYTFFKLTDLSRSNNLKKTFIITNILIKILLITYIYYLLNLFLNPKTFDGLTLSLSILSLWSNGMNIDAYHVGMTMSLWSLNFPFPFSHVTCMERKRNCSSNSKFQAIRISTAFPSIHWGNYCDNFIQSSHSP